MKAALYENYGDAGVLSVGDVVRPEPGKDEILVKVYSAAVTTADWRLRASAFPGVMWLPGRLMFGLRRPRNPILGNAFSGRVVSRGSDVERFRLGDALFGFAQGAHAEYLVVKADGAVVHKPKAITYEEAAAVPFGAISALVFLRDFAKVKPGDKVLVNGASGAVGVWAVQLARHLGASVTGVAGTDNLDLVKSLGAEKVVDYRREDVAESGTDFDVVLDPVGKLPYSLAKRMLKPGGRYVPLEFSGREMIQALVAKLTGGPKIVLAISNDSRDDLEYLAGLLDSGEIRAVVDSRFPLGDIADAHRRVETRHVRGSLVLSLETPEAAAVAA